MPLDNCSTEIQMKKRFAQKICRYAVKCHEWLKKTESIVWEANDSSITLQKLRQSNLKCQATNKQRKMSSGFFFQMTGECYGTMYTMYTWVYVL